jgi:hypothetical protein
MALADSQLTREWDGRRAISNKAVKLHVASQRRTTYAAERYDILFAMSGNLLLGLQSVLYVDACLQGTSGTWVDAMINIIDDKLLDFWSDAITKEITYSISLHDHKRRARIFEWRGENPRGTPSMREAEEEHGLLFSVHGDRAAFVRQRILSEIQRCSCHGIDPNHALPYSCIRALRAEIDDPTSIYIGGNIQAAYMRGHIAEHLVCDNGTSWLRSAALDDWEGLDYQVLDLMDPSLDPSKNLYECLLAGKTSPLGPVRDPRNE